MSVPNVSTAFKFIIERDRKCLNKPFWFGAFSRAKFILGVFCNSCKYLCGLCCVFYDMLDLCAGMIMAARVNILSDRYESLCLVFVRYINW